MSYKSPITTSMSQIYDDVLRNFDDVLMVRVREAIEFDIDKDELIKALAYDRGQYKEGFDAGYADGYRAGLEGERKTGKWLETDDGYDGTYYDCSVCGESWTTTEGTPWEIGMKFCPNCGARMENADEKEEEQ